MDNTINDIDPKLGDEIIFNDYYSTLKGIRGKIISVTQFGQFKIQYKGSNGIPKRINASIGSFDVINREE